MSSKIQNILDGVLGDVARSTKFEVLFTFTDSTSNIRADEIIMMGKTASFPGKTHTTIDLKYKGRSIPIKGQTKYTQTWDCTFYLTEDHGLKKAFENWIEALDQHHNYNDAVNEAVRRTQKNHNKNAYTTQLKINQRNFSDERDTIEYTLLNAYPTEVSQVQTNYESRGELLEFTVTFSYSHFTSENKTGKHGNFIDTIVDKVDKITNDAIQNALTRAGDGINGYLSSTANKLTELNNSIINTASSENSQNTGVTR